jgi:hypothetical protein
MTNITVPLPRPKRGDSFDHPVPINNIVYLGIPPPYVQYRNNSEKITLMNYHELTFIPFETKEIFFPIQITTSLLCYSIISGSALLFRQGLKSDLSIQLTNDSFLSTKIHNYTMNTCTFPPFSLNFDCFVVISPFDFE